MSDQNTRDREPVVLDATPIRDGDDVVFDTAAAAATSARRPSWLARAQGVLIRMAIGVVLLGVLVLLLPFVLLFGLLALLGGRRRGSWPNVSFNVIRGR